MIFSVFCCASARWGKRNPVVRPAAAAAPPVTLTNFLRLSFDMGISLLVRNQRWGEATKTEGFYARRERGRAPEMARTLRALTSIIGPTGHDAPARVKGAFADCEKCETSRPRPASQER